MRIVPILIPFYGTLFVAFSSSSPRLFNTQTIDEHRARQQIKRKLCISLSCERNREILSGKKTPSPTCKVEDTIKSEPSELTNDTTCMKFKIPGNISQNSLAINQADLCIHVKKKGKRKQRKSRKTRKNRRITLKIFEFKEGKTQKKLIARFKFRPSSTKFYKIPLSIRADSEIKGLSQRYIHLCVSCIKCNRKTTITFPLKKKVFRSSKPKTKLKLKKNRPYLRIKAKKPFKSRSKRGRNTRTDDNENDDCE